MGSSAKPQPERVPNKTRWGVDCRNCFERFTYSEIEEAATLSDYMFPTKPEFSASGQELECPYCKTTALYRQQDLRYRHD
jgi:hypothetical protein